MTDHSTLANQVRPKLVTHPRDRMGSVQRALDAPGAARTHGVCRAALRAAAAGRSVVWLVLTGVLYWGRRRAAPVLVANACLVFAATVVVTAIAAPAASGERYPDKPLRTIVTRLGTEATNIPRAGITGTLEAEPSIDLESVRLLEPHEGRLDGSQAGYAAVARELDLDLLVTGDVERRAGRTRITITPIDGRDGSSLPQLTFEAASLNALRLKLRAELWAELEPILREAFGKDAKAVDPDPLVLEEAPEPEAEPEVEPDAKEAEHRETAKPPRRGAEAAHFCPWLELEALGGIKLRRYNYVNEVRGALRAYTLNQAPMARGEATFYPLSGSGCGIEGGLGLALGYERLLSVRSTLADRDLATSASAETAELVLRVPLARWLSLVPRVGYRGRLFAVAGDVVPDAAYRSVRGGLEVRVKAGWFLLEASGGYRFPLLEGELTSAQWFPEATGFGYDLSGRLGVAPFDWLDVLAGAAFEQYVFHINAGVGAYPNGVAEAWFDSYLEGHFGLRFHVPRRATLD